VRIESMFENGLLDEVKGLLAKGYSSDLPTMSAIGYRECVRVIEGRMSVEQAKVEMRRVTRMFVRRQSNWFKESDPNIHWFHAGEENMIENIVAFIRQAMPE
jgi:tRNA dimethylallyltransferase